MEPVADETDALPGLRYCDGDAGGEAAGEAIGETPRDPVAERGTDEAPPAPF
jgi:hypothetical protein